MWAGSAEMVIKEGEREKGGGMGEKRRGKEGKKAEKKNKFTRFIHRPLA